jgi:gliding motility-associated-like protein
MKKLTILLFILALFTFIPSAYATHLFGADFYYTHVSGNTYTLVLDMYGDCSGAAFPNLNVATPEVEVYDNGALFQLFTLALSGTPIEVTPVCPSQINNTTCNGGTIPGIKKFTYTGTVVLNGPSTGWLFRFTGNMGANNLAGRSNNMTNISVPSSGSVMVLEATLNNSSAPNSSVTYTTIPTPFFCINQATQYNPGAIDANGDNLTFSLVDGIVPGGGTAAYIAPYTGALPLGVQSGTFSFNNITGQLGFTPNIQQKSLVVYRVEEYRNGVLVGTSMREMTFVVLTSCNNGAPVPGPISNLNNGTLSSPFQIQVCKGASGNLSFDFLASDPNNDHITVTFAGLPAGATATIGNNGNTAPQFNFSWNISAVNYGNYTFYVTMKDDGCPLASTQTYAYTIAVGGFGPLPPHGALSGCINQSNALAWVHPVGSSSYTYTWQDASGQVVHQITSTTGDTVKTLAPGVYSVRMLNTIGCDTTFSITVPTPNYHASFTSDSSVCLQEGISFQNTSTQNFASWSWDFGDGATSQQKDPNHTYTQTGSYTVRLIAHTANGCEDTVSESLTVREVILAVTGDSIICEKQSGLLSASGAASYAWTPVATLSCPTCASTLATPPATTTYTVTGTDAIGCEGSAQFTINVLPTGLEVTPQDTSICPGDSVQLHVSGATDFRWIPTTGLSDSGAHPWVHPESSLAYMVVASYPNGCRDTEQVHILFVSNAVIYMPDSVTLYPGESYQMDPQGNCLYFSWFPPLGLTATNIANPTATPPVNTRYFVTGTTEGGCMVSDSIDIYVALESLLEVPNAFTPGNNGVNDQLKVIRRGSATLKYFRIYNRWGNKVYESSNIDEGWNGNYKGTPQPMGVYVFMVEAYTNTGRKFYKQGNVTLIR